MSWWLSIIEHLRNPENEINGRLSLKKVLTRALAESAVDLLYYSLGIFTSIYFLFGIYLFFWRSQNYQILTQIFGAMIEPYLGSVGIYVILKEVRKRQLKTNSKHLGEYFVLSWLIFLLISGGLVLFTPQYRFDALMGAIITISLAIIVIYTGGLIHKP